MERHIDKNKFVSLMKAKGDNYETFGVKVGLSQAAVSRVANLGRATSDTIDKICKGLMCTPNDIWDLSYLETKED